MVGLDKSEIIFKLSIFVNGALLPIKYFQCTDNNFKKNYKMKNQFLSVMVICFSLSSAVNAQSADPKAVMAQIKKNLDSSQKNLSTFTWIETTTIYKGDEVKSEMKNQCSYGWDRKIAKVPIGAPAAEEKEKRGVRGKIVENKKEDMSDYVKKSIAKVHEYLPPNPEKLKAINAAGKVNIQVVQANVKYTMSFPDYLKAGDKMAITLDMQKALFGGIVVNTFLDKPDDKINFTLNYGVLTDGTEYPAETILDLPKEGLKIVIKNDGYKKEAPKQ